MRLLMRVPSLLIVIGVSIGAISIVEAKTGWSGESNGSGGVASYGYQLRPGDAGFDPELQEDEWMRVRCDGYDGRISISFGTNVNEADATAHNVIFEIGSDRFERDGPIDQGGLFPGAPIAMLQFGDPLATAMMNGSSMRVHVGTERPEPLMNISLSGTRQVFFEHLRPCLRR